mmetsp:Transcript_1446/g.3707  ORF Transcript_1446/g.3707 Transcript_1446/m.3707 type:complete len:94 (+) Transcript_1446:175-456(+)
MSTRSKPKATVLPPRVRVRIPRKANTLCMLHPLFVHHLDIVKHETSAFNFVQSRSTELRNKDPRGGTSVRQKSIGKRIQIRGACVEISMPSLS